MQYGTGPILRDQAGAPLPEAPGFVPDTSKADQQFGPEGHAARVEWVLKNLANTALPISDIEHAYDRAKSAFTGSKPQYNARQPGATDVMMSAGVKAPTRFGVLEHPAGASSYNIENPQRFADWFQNSKAKLNLVNPQTMETNRVPQVLGHSTSAYPEHLRGSYIPGQDPVQDFLSIKKGKFDVGSHVGTPLAANDRLSATSIRETPIQTIASAPDEHITLPPDQWPNRSDTRKTIPPYGTNEWTMEPGSRILPVYASVQNPIVMNDTGHWGPVSLWTEARKQGLISQPELEKQLANIHQSSAFTINTPDDLINHLKASIMPGGQVDRYGMSQDAWVDLMKKNGIDAIQYANDIEHPGSTSYSVFDPGQLKSVFNPGLWDIANPDLMKSVLPPAVVGGAALRSIYGDSLNSPKVQPREATPESY